MLTLGYIQLIAELFKGGTITCDSSTNDITKSGIRLGSSNIPFAIDNTLNDCKGFTGEALDSTGSQDVILESGQIKISKSLDVKSVSNIVANESLISLNISGTETLISRDVYSSVRQLTRAEYTALGQSIDQNEIVYLSDECKYVKNQSPELSSISPLENSQLILEPNVNCTISHYLVVGSDGITIIKSNYYYMIMNVLKNSYSAFLNKNSNSAIMSLGALSDKNRIYKIDASENELFGLIACSDANGENIINSLLYRSVVLETNYDTLSVSRVIKNVSNYPLSINSIRVDCIGANFNTNGTDVDHTKLAVNNSNIATNTKNTVPLIVLKNKITLLPNQSAKILFNYSINPNGAVKIMPNVNSTTSNSTV